MQQQQQQDGSMPMMFPGMGLPDMSQQQQQGGGGEVPGLSMDVQGFLASIAAQAGLYNTLPPDMFGGQPATAAQEGPAAAAGGEPAQQVAAATTEAGASAAGDAGEDSEVTQ
jgi:hypothetical protein